MEIKITYSTGKVETIEAPDGSRPADVIAAKFGSGVALEEQGARYEVMPDVVGATTPTAVQKVEAEIKAEEVKVEAEAVAILHKVEDLLHIKHA